LSEGRDPASIRESDRRWPAARSVTPHVLTLQRPGEFTNITIGD
jgi:hypothetical protein